MQQGFIFDLNKCVGCHACVVACQIENGPDQSTPWRTISTFNELQHPDLPVFHYSLACNHCEDAPCMNSCPALAYTKDESLNTITHHANRCIGCKYCTWACPYDAPKFVQADGVVEKCTFCQHRLQEEQKPACANLCPTGALDYNNLKTSDHSRIPGFTDLEIGPGIDIIRLRTRKAPRSVLRLDKKEEQQIETMESKATSKVTIEKEWVLVLFTLLAPSLTGVLAAASLGMINLNPLVFGFGGILGLLLSSIHLGKKLRAWRSILNIRNSWLSREILGYGLFLGTALAWFLFPDLRIIAYISVLFGFATSYAIDKVYLYFEKTTGLDLQSNSVFLTALLMTSMFTANESFALLILGIKLLLYVYRKIYFVLHGKKINIPLSLTRVIFGFFIPLLLWYFLNFSATWIIVTILFGEFIDRIEFYLEGEIITPKRQIIKDFKILKAS